MSGPVIRGLLAIAFLAFAVSQSSIAEAAQAPRVTVQELKKNWKRYDGKTVRLRGDINSCWGGDCEICAEDVTPKTFNDQSSRRCITVGFGPQRDGLLFQRLYRFANVTIDATFNSECFSDEKGDSVGGLCTDGPANLRSARVIELHSRKSAKDALFGNNSYVGDLSLPSDAELEPMLDEFVKVMDHDRQRMMMFKVTRITPENPDTAALRLRDDYPSPDPYSVDGMGCLCWEDSCSGEWPQRAFLGFNSPANPYECWFMHKEGNSWRVFPDAAD